MLGLQGGNDKLRHERFIMEITVSISRQRVQGRQLFSGGLLPSFSFVLLRVVYNYLHVLAVTSTTQPRGPRLLSVESMDSCFNKSIE